MMRQLLSASVCALLLAACARPTAAPPATAPAATTVTPAAFSGAAIVADGTLAPRAVTHLAFAAGGRVAEVLVAEGERVQAGDLLARLGDGAAQNAAAAQSAAAARAAQEVLAAENALAALTEVDPLAQAEARLALANAQVALEAAERKHQGLTGGGLRGYQAAVAQAEAALLTARENAQLTDIGELAGALEAAEARLAAATQTLSDAQSAQAQCPACVEVYAGGRMLPLAQAQAEYDAARDAAEAAGIRLAQAQRAAGAGVAALEGELQAAQARLEAASSPKDSAVGVAQAEVALAQAQLEAARRAVKGPTAEQVAEARARLETAQAERAAALAALAATELRATEPGIVVELLVRAGEHVSAGQPAASVADLDHWMVQTTNVTEMEVPALEIGQAATMRVDALPDLALAGEVTAIAATPETRSGEVLYTVEIAVSTNDERLRWGMTVEVSFIP